MSQDAAQSQSKAASQKVKSDDAAANNNNNNNSFHAKPTDGSVSGGPVPPFAFHPSSGPRDALDSRLPSHIPACGIERARALRKAWLIQTREMPPARDEPDWDDVEDCFDECEPFDPPVHLPQLLLLLTDIWQDEEA